MQKGTESDKQIKDVFDKLGETLEYEKKALRKMNVGGLKLGKWERLGLIVITVVSLSVWIGWYQNRIQELWALLVVVFDLTLIGIAMVYNLCIPIWHAVKTPVRQRVNEIGKRTVGNWIAGKELAKIADMNILNQVELLLKSELEEFQARMDFMLNFLKSINPFLIAVGVLLGIFGVSLKSSGTAGILMLIGAGANIIGFISGIGLRPEIIRCIQCLSIIKQAKALKENEAGKQPTVSLPSCLPEHMSFANSSRLTN
jgi:flagellar motor component MotA